MSLKDPPKIGYVSIRDDDGLKSLSRNERAFTRECALPALGRSRCRGRSLRIDGRTSAQVRPVRLHLGRWDHGSECTVQWGNTRVTSLCTAELVRPNLDRPNEGQLVISVDLSPGASPSFRLAPPATTGGGGGGGGSVPNFAGQNQRLAANRILRCIEKIIITGGTLDVEALCLIPSQWVWRFRLALSVVDDGGNIMDAAVMAAIASLRHYRKPQVDMVGDTATNTTSNGNDQGNTITTAAAATTPVLIPSHLKEPTPLPLHHTPLSISFAFCPMEDGSSHSTAAATSAAASTLSSSSSSAVAALMDPTDREELIQNGSLTVGMNIHAEVCLLDYGGGCELPPTQLRECWKQAETSIRKLCTMLETSLEEADQQAQKDRLAKLQQQQQQQQQKTTTATTTTSQIDDALELPPLPPGDGVFFQQSDNPGESSTTNNDAADTREQVRRLETEAEEAYKRKALDYDHGYQAQKVREDNDVMASSSQPYFNQASNLFKALLQQSSSSQQQAEQQASTSNKDEEEEEKMTASATSAPTTTMTKKAAPTTKEKEGKPAAATTTTKQLKAGQIDSDEEETTEMLQSEFQTTTTAELQSKKESQPTPMDVDDHDDDIDDLAMAISSKKKKKKKKSKK